MAVMTGDPAWRVLLPPNRPLAPAQRSELAARLGGAAADAAGVEQGGLKTLTSPYNSRLFI